LKGNGRQTQATEVFAVIGEIKASIQLSGKNAEFIKKLKLASYYKGDSKRLLQLAPDARTTYMQFTHK